MNGNEENYDNKQFHIKEFYQLQGEVKGIRESMDLQFKNLKEFIHESLESINRATEKALASNDKRLDIMNEFRQSLKDQSGTFITKDEYSGKHELLKEEIKRLELSKAEFDGKASTEQVVAANTRADSAKKIGIWAIAATIGLFLIHLLFDLFNKKSVP